MEQFGETVKEQLPIKRKRPKALKAMLKNKLYRKKRVNRKQEHAVNPKAVKKVWRCDYGRVFRVRYKQI